MSLSAGTRLGRYEIRSQLGAGGMGEVYLAQDTRLNRKVAIKILPFSLASDQVARRYYEALKQIQKSKEIDPGHFGQFVYFAQVYEMKGMYDEAIKELLKATAVGGRTSAVLSLLGYAYAASGKQAEAQKILAELNEMSGSVLI